jgi:hypothetical protein
MSTAASHRLASQGGLVQLKSTGGLGEVGDKVLYHCSVTTNFHHHRFALR